MACQGYDRKRPVGSFFFVFIFYFFYFNRLGGHGMGKCYLEMGCGCDGFWARTDSRAKKGKIQ